MKSSKRGLSIVKVEEYLPCGMLQIPTENTSSGSTNLNETASQVVTSQTEKSQEKVCSYGWKAEYAAQQRSIDPLDSWALEQAASLAMRQVSVNEARMILKHFDPVTRELRKDQPAPRPSGFVAALRAMVCGGMILTVAACTKDKPAPAQLQQGEESMELIADAGYVRAHKFVDRVDNNVCYVATHNGTVSMECLVREPGHER